MSDPKGTRRRTFLSGRLPSAFAFGVLAAAAIALAFLSSTLTVRPAAAQQAGCNRCVTIGPFSFPNPFASPSPAPYEPEPTGRVRRSGERRRSAVGHLWGVSAEPRHEAADQTGKSVYVCVRKCDGGFFPLPYSGASGATLEEICRALCPAADMALYTMPFGGTIDEAVSPTGARYTSEPNALKFQSSYEVDCSCRRPGQSWAQALAAAEAKYGHRSHDIIVTAAASVAMSRPKPDPHAKLAAPGASAGLPPGSLDPGLDANGVDTRLKAATAAISRETSGIKDDDPTDISHIGLKEGQVVEENAPDGGLRRVRILAPAD